MDRQIVWPGAIPLETDILNTNRNMMVALGRLAMDVLGTGTLVAGLACAPTSVPGMAVNIGPGAIYSLQNIDNTAYSSLAADTTDQVVAQLCGCDVADAGQEPRFGQLLHRPTAGACGVEDEHFVAEFSETLTCDSAGRRGHPEAGGRGV